MSNPYDPNSSPNPYGGSDPSAGGYGQGGYGQGGGQGGGFGSPYGQPGPYGNEAPKKTDAVSIVGFILSLTCCLSVVGAILGFVGLSRTKGGKRKGRWAAIAASIIGVIGTVVVAGLVIFIVYINNKSVLPSDAEEGQCVSTSLDDDESVLLLDKDCSDDHDAEITWVGTFSDIEGTLGSTFVPDDVNDLTDSAVEEAVCSSLTDPAYVEALGDEVTFSIVREDEDPSGSDPLMCYAEKLDGSKFTEHAQP